MGAEKSHYDTTVEKEDVAKLSESRCERGQDPTLWEINLQRAKREQILN